jgi:UbiD family decarboxylase
MDLQDIYKIAQVTGKSVLDANLIPREYAVTRLSYENRSNIIVSRVEGLLEDSVVFSNLITSRRDIQLLIGASSLEETYVKLLRSSNSPRELEAVSFSDYFTEVDVDLRKLPFLKYYREDGGLYLTSSVYIACYESICNASFHRTMYLSRDRAVLRIVPRHLHYIMTKYREHGKDTPVALVLGLSPLQELAASMSPPLGVFEVSVGATLTGDSRVVKTPHYGIPVPAEASIVIEGTISSNERAVEGPFTDILMLVDQAREQPVFTAEHVYVSRRTPRASHAIVPGLWEHQLLMGFPREAQIYVEVKRAVPCVSSVRLTEGGFTWLHAVIAVSEKCSYADAKLAAIVAMAAHPSVKHIVVVDDDIDVDNPLMIEWAIATRCKGSEDILVIPNIRGSTLEPRSLDGVGDKVVAMAIKPRNEPATRYNRVRIP